MYNCKSLIAIIIKHHDITFSMSVAICHILDPIKNYILYGKMGSERPFSIMCACTKVPFMIKSQIMSHKLIYTASTSDSVQGLHVPVNSS